jgi:hypothetical protein
MLHHIRILRDLMTQLMIRNREYSIISNVSTTAMSEAKEDLENAGRCKRQGRLKNNNIFCLIIVRVLG